MTQELWTAVDQYFAGLLVPHDRALDDTLAAAAAAGLPPISVSPCQGKLLHILVRLCRARSILEIGTLAGYSTIWMARGLEPGGRVTTLEINPEYAEVARANFARAGLADVIELRLGPAIETLPRIASEGRGPFDIIFIDADKPSNPEYFAWAMKLSRRGSVIVIDNVVRDGAVIDGASKDASVQGTRRVLDMLHTEPRVSATAIQTVGVKGYDGFVIALVDSDVAE